MDRPRRLTLGALYREMRAGLGDAGWVRVTVEFRQQTISPSEASGDAGTGEGAALVLQALIDQQDGVLHRGEIALVGAGGEQRLVVRRGDDRYAYSVDGGHHWGAFATHPRIFDVTDFEAQLEQVEVEDVTFEPVPGMPARSAEGSVPERWLVGDRGSADALDVSLDRQAFARLLRIFSADLDEEPDTLSLSAYSVSLEAAEDVSLLYWWSLSGLDEAGAAPEGDAGGRSLRVSCSVSIRIAPAPPPNLEGMEMADDLPEVSRLDDVWALLRGGGARRWRSEAEAAGS